MTGARTLFSVFDVTRQVFFESRWSLGIVNLKPLRPGPHNYVPATDPYSFELNNSAIELTADVLIISKRNVPRLSDLHAHEVSDLFTSVQRVGRVIEKAYAAKALNIALQDGVAAGQSVPHVHVHIIPRLASDFGGVTDNVYPALEQSERELVDDLQQQDKAQKLVRGWQVPRDEDRRPRTLEEMEDEATWLARLLREAGVESDLPDKEREKEMNGNGKREAD